MSKDYHIMKRAVIAGAALALRYKEKNPSYSEEEVLKYVVAELTNIIEKIDKK